MDAEIAPAEPEDTVDRIGEPELPKDLIDLDEEEVALDGTLILPEEGSSKFSTAAKIIIICIVVLMAALVGAFVILQNRSAKKSRIMNSVDKTKNDK